VRTWATISTISSNRNQLVVNRPQARAARSVDVLKVKLLVGQDREHVLARKRLHHPSSDDLATSLHLGSSGRR
jgi:hypothetical protein